MDEQVIVGEPQAGEPIVAQQGLPGEAQQDAPVELPQGEAQAPQQDAPVEAQQVKPAAQKPRKRVGELVRARVLVDLGELRCEDLVEGDAASIKALVDSGVADSHPDAVAYALEFGAQVKSI